MLGMVAGRPTHADIVVIAAHDSPINTITVQETAHLYMGRINGVAGIGATPILLYDLPDGPLRETFFRLLNGMSIEQVNAYWARLQFSGNVLPPTRLSNARAVLDAVSHHLNAIGYVDDSSVDASVKILLRLRE